MTDAEFDKILREIYHDKKMAEALNDDNIVFNHDLDMSTVSPLPKPKRRTNVAMPTQAQLDSGSNFIYVDFVKRQVIK